MTTFYDSALFQINRKLYRCGGSKSFTFSTSGSCFASLESSGEEVDLASLRSSRRALSLCGLPSLLLSLGGWNEGQLTTCEKYLISSNKWKGLPGLSTARMRAGSVLLQSQKAFCFCGTQEHHQLNSIESLQIGLEQDWRTLALSS